MEGFIEFITSEDPEAKFLRKHCVFKIVPMLNPDGVIHGNYRSSLCGRDLNRIWNNPNPTLQPTIYHTKELVRKLQEKRNLLLFCDLHGHSRKYLCHTIFSKIFHRKNAFFYGNASNSNPYSPRILPFILSKFSKYVSFEDCRFVMQKAKEKTARIALWRQAKIDNIFTLEASFYGYNHNGGTLHFTKDDYRNLGQDLCIAIRIYLNLVTFKNSNSIPMSPKNSSVNKTDKEHHFNQNVRKTQPNISIREIRKVSIENLETLLEELRNNKRLIDEGDKGDDSGSDTDISKDEIPMKELKKALPMKGLYKIGRKKNNETSRKKDFLTDLAKKEEKNCSPIKADHSITLEPKPIIQENFKIKKKKLKAIMPLSRDAAMKRRFFNHDQNPVETESIAIQTDPDPFLVYEDREPLPEELNFTRSAAFKFGQRSARDWLYHEKQLRSRSPLPYPVEQIGLTIVGEKAGSAIQNGIDANYKLGKNQVTRSTLTKLKARCQYPEPNATAIKESYSRLKPVKVIVPEITSIPEIQSQEKIIKQSALKLEESE